jgi:hypothetical protein
MAKQIKLASVLKSSVEATPDKKPVPVVTKESLCQSGEPFQIGGAEIKTLPGLGTLITFGIRHKNEVKELKLVATKPIREVANAARELKNDDVIGDVVLKQTGDFFFFAEAPGKGSAK